MDSNRKAEFVKRMRLKNGGLVKRRKMAGGGVALPYVGQVGSQPSPTGSVPGTDPLGGLPPDTAGALRNIGLFNGNTQAPGGGVPPVSGGVAPTTDFGFGYRPSVPGLIEPVTAPMATDALTGATGAVDAQGRLVGELGAQGGIGKQVDTYNQLDDVSQGRGPNPAQALLSERTAENVAAQGAMMAGQRGASQNVGLMTRQVAQQGAATQQQAIEQAAALEAQQRLSAIGQKGQLATNMTGNYINQTVAHAQLSQAEQQAILDAIMAQNSGNISMQQNINNVNAGLAGSVMEMTGKAVGGVGAAVGSALPYLAGSGGGAAAATGASVGGDLGADLALAKGGRVVKGPHASHVANFLFAEGGEVGGDVPALVSPDEVYLTPQMVKEVQHGANPLKVGHRFKGKAKVKGDSTQNDTIPATLQEGGVVLPRHITKMKDPNKARLFVLKSLAKKGKN